MSTLENLRDEAVKAVVLANTLLQTAEDTENQAFASQDVAEREELYARAAVAVTYYRVAKAKEVRASEAYITAWAEERGFLLGNLRHESYVKVKDTVLKLGDLSARVNFLHMVADGSVQVYVNYILNGRACDQMLMVTEWGTVSHPRRDRKQAQKNKKSKALSPKQIRPRLKGFKVTKVIIDTLED